MGLGLRRPGHRFAAQRANPNVWPPGRFQSSAGLLVLHGLPWESCTARKRATPLSQPLGLPWTCSGMRAAALALPICLSALLALLHELLHVKRQERRQRRRAKWLGLEREPQLPSRPKPRPRPPREPEDDGS